MSPSEKKSLEEIHRLFLEIEKTTPSQPEAGSGIYSFNLEKLTGLKNKITCLAASESKDISRLSTISKHLTAEMTLKHFVSYAIPFERLLHKIVQDDDFLIIENDKGPNAFDEPKNPRGTSAAPLVFVLDNIRSAFNVGSIFRTAECLGAQKIILCGYTPLPIQSKVEKTAMGTQDYMNWEEGGKLSDCLQKLKSEGYLVIVLETAAMADNIYTEFRKKPTAFVLGNERFGIDPEHLKSVDEIRMIPLQGRKNSLNVGVSAAIAGFEWMRQWKIK